VGNYSAFRAAGLAPQAVHVPASSSAPLSSFFSFQFLNRAGSHDSEYICVFCQAHLQARSTDSAPTSTTTSAFATPTKVRPVHSSHAVSSALKANQPREYIMQRRRSSTIIIPSTAPVSAVSETTTASTSSQYVLSPVTEKALRERANRVAPPRRLSALAAAAAAGVIGNTLSTTESEDFMTLIRPVCHVFFFFLLFFQYLIHN
jgi:hypothetical protein